MSETTNDNSNKVNTNSKPDDDEITQQRKYKREIQLLCHIINGLIEWIDMQYGLAFYSFVAFFVKYQAVLHVKLFTKRY